MEFVIKDFETKYADSLNNLALEAFGEYRNAYNDWPAFSKKISDMASFADHAEIIVATQSDALVGAVVYVGPDRPKSDIFASDWAVLRMLVVAPQNRGLGIGKALTQECIQRAVRDNASHIGLHTSPVMKVALPMYSRMGFVKQTNVADIYGVPYAVYAKNVSSQSKK
ncbi:GNAT family N-acetyltransferase [Sulfurimonas sp. HSL-3221]|uniref:GNAT family N-acetyltransferase n=1 Tax=Sulfurimonadaceae TaxID=2771471 RepID=UPI001E61EEA4|nr:GNAT family N-acetyltransferase [Sulfurimonas sp. HSL-3221]UFS63353.1 GNAT family N-acetyltransferase [Sulfurimonas sp. HSL-3221]